MNSSPAAGATVQARTESYRHGTGHPAGVTFAHRSLNITPSSRKTRFLELLPAKSHQDGIRCMIYDSFLDNPPVYEALSYTWGSQDNLRPVFLSYKQDDNRRIMSETSGETKAQADPGSGTRFEIAPSLEAAFRHIRLLNEPRTLWVDAICINQKDEIEKGRQIGYMRDIYLGAQRVVAWLGEEKDAMEALKFLNAISWVAPDCSDYVFNKEDVPKWKACGDLFTREYWKRSWTLQEVLHHKEVIFHLGTKKVSIDDISASFDKYFYTKLGWASQRDSIVLSKYQSKTLPEPGDWRYDGWNNATAMFESAPDTLSNTLKQLEASKNLSEPGDWRYDGWFQATATSQSAPDALFTVREELKNSDAAAPRLSRLLHVFRNQQVGKPRDKIYSMLCMAKPEYEIPIVYKTREMGGFSDGDIYTITTRQMLSRVLLVLLWVESLDRNIASSLDNDTLPSWVPNYTTKQQLTARTMLTTYDYFSADKGFPGGMSSKNTDKSLPNNHPLFVVRGVYVACITGTHHTYVTGNWIVKDNFKDYHQLKLIQYDRNPALRTGTVGGKSDAWPGTSDVDISFENASWGPCKAEIGDLIIVAAGCKIPLVLRKHGKEYLLVGGCWLVDSRIKDFRNLEVRDDAFSGLMYGDAVKEIEIGSVVEEFVLC